MSKAIAVDGPSGVGKSSVSRLLAERLDWTYLDTGAMYRALTLEWLRSGAEKALLCDPDWLDGVVLDFSRGGIWLNGEDVSQSIRGNEVTDHVSMVSAIPEVRRCLTAMQRRFADRRDCVLDGRDIGTVVLPQAFLKVFLTASPEIRARRRWLQAGNDRAGKSHDQVKRDLIERDRLDSSRALAPLKPAKDAWVVDTEHMSRDQVVECLFEQAQRGISRSG